MIFEQILLANNLRECMKISMENLFVDTGQKGRSYEVSHQGICSWKHS